VNLGLALAVFGVIFVAELPDKTMIATVVMGSRSSALPVWIGASCAFVVHMGIASVAGHFLALLPHRALEIIVTILFLGGAAYLLFVPEKSELTKGEAEAAAEASGAFVKVAATSFAVIFIGEFGDLTQILAANFVARSHQALTVFIAGTIALITVSALGSFGGRALLRVLPLSRIRLGGGILLAGFGIYSLISAITG
jgi:putative Ca2+/H+ antiporter (TMEM165/GDT1 family)